MISTYKNPPNPKKAVSPLAQRKVQEKFVLIKNESLFRIEVEEIPFVCLLLGKEEKDGLEIPKEVQSFISFTIFPQRSSLVDSHQCESFNIA